MTNFISYAQNFEDVMLWRALHDVENGLYIDVGANDPEVDSVTKAFYDLGWHGINIEPLGEFWQRLQQARPRDINLQMVAAGTSGSTRFFQVLHHGHGLSTTQPDIAERHRKAGLTIVETDVRAETLSRICAEHVQSDVHFLKIDVEGGTREVIAGLDLTQVRPWIIVVEATEPMSQTPAFTTWEPLITSRNYDFEYYDGVNRFYLSREHAELAAAFDYPPNFFDGFTLRATEVALERARDAETRVVEANDRVRKASTRAVRAERERDATATSLRRVEQSYRDMTRQLEAREAMLEAVLASRSWRVTAPLRIVSGRLRLSQTKRMRAIIADPLGSAVRYAAHRPRLKRAGLWLLPFPAARSYLRRVRTNQLQAGPLPLNPPDAPSALPLSDSACSAVPHTATRYFGKRVAVLGPRSVTGAEGGAERFYRALIEALRAAGCDAQPVTIPVDESTYSGIQAGYKSFSELSLPDFDLVISTKAPSYVVHHSNHILYLMHTMRVFYDMFDDTFPRGDLPIQRQREWIIAQDTAAFGTVSRRFVLSSEVRQRLVKWNKCDAEVLQPPLAITGLYDAGIGDYFFMPGRLHPWKRVDLAIRAIQRSHLTMRLVISGAGEAEAELRNLAGNDRRIEFVGHVDEGALRDLYAHALAVVFLPIREDYGYVTLEAFASGKPVVTCTDSGEPLAFVTDGVDGKVCQPRDVDVCRTLELLWTDHALTSRMAKAAKKHAFQASWASVARRLLETGFPTAVTPARARAPLKVAILDMQPITPPIGGGRVRLLGLYHSLGYDIRARYVGTYDWRGEEYFRRMLTPSLEEIDVPLSTDHYAAAADVVRRVHGKTVIDAMFAEQAHLSPDYLREAQSAVQWANVVVFSHPWVAPLIEDVELAGRLVVYDAHNVEADLRTTLFDVGDPDERAVLASAVAAESCAVARADLILACSNADAERFVARYGVPYSKIRVCPNGAFVRASKPARTEDRSRARSALGLTRSSFVCFFIGSDYAPNVDAGAFLAEELAPALPDVTFAIGGGVCAHLQGPQPPNVRVLGILEDSEKLTWLQASDLAANPVEVGSGTNIKMFEFMAAGLPVITTPVGARGISDRPTPGLWIIPRHNFASAILQLRSTPDDLGAAGRANRTLAEACYAWESLSPTLGCTVRSAWLRKRGYTLLNGSDATPFRVAHLSTTGLTCGIGEYARKLIDTYQHHGIRNLLLAAKASNETLNRDGIHCDVREGWIYDTSRPRNSRILPSTIGELTTFRATHLIIQYRPSFFSSNALLDFALAARDRDIDVVVVVHKFADEQAEAFSLLRKHGVLLFAHRMAEISRARALGVWLDHIPHGITDTAFVRDRTAPARDFHETPPLLITTGFLRRHKGTATLIEAMPTVLEQFPAAHLIIQCAL